MTLINILLQLKKDIATHNTKLMDIFSRISDKMNKLCRTNKRLKREAAVLRETIQALNTWNDDLEWTNCKLKTRAIKAESESRYNTEEKERLENELEAFTSLDKDELLIRGYPLVLHTKEIKHKRKGENILSNRVFVPCNFSLYDDNYMLYGGRWCKDHQVRTSTWGIMKGKAMLDMIDRVQILESKDKNTAKREQTLRDLNKKMILALKENNTCHRNKLNKMENDLKYQKTKCKETKQMYDDFKARYVRRVQTQINDVGQKLLDAETLVETYTKHKEQIEILKDYEALDDFIKSTCYERSGVERDYYAVPPVYNNIYTMKKLMNIEDLIKTSFNMSIHEFTHMFLGLKNRRVIIAHPKVKTANITILKRIISKYHSS